MEDTDNLRVERIIKLNKDNFLEFREAVMDKALRFGDPGIWLNNGQYPRDRREPALDMRELVEDPDNPGQWIEGQNRKYPQGQGGQQQFSNDYQKYHKNRDKALQLISWLITNVEKDIRAKLDAAAGFRDACATADVLAVCHPKYRYGTRIHLGFLSHGKVYENKAKWSE